MPYPIDKYAGAVLAARGAGGWPVSGQMLSRAVLCGARGKNKVKLKGFRLARISQTVQSLTIGLFKNLFSCYFWRKSNQNVGVGHTCERTETAAEPSPPREQECLGGLSSACETPPHPRTVHS